MFGVLFGALGLLGAAAVSAAEEKRYGAVSYSMGGRGAQAGVGASSSMGGRQVGEPYEWDTPSGTVMRWNVPGGIYGATETDLEAANAEMAALVEQNGGTVLGAGDLHLEGAQPAFYTEASFPNFAAANRALVGSKSTARKYRCEGDCVWLFAGENRYVILWSNDDHRYFSRWWDALNAAEGRVLNVREVFADRFGIMILGIPIGRESRIEHLGSKIERAEGKIADLEAEAKTEGANVEKLARKIARYEQKKEKWEDKLETLEMKESMGYTGGAIGSYDLLGGSVAEEMFAPDLFSDDDDDEDEDDEDDEFGRWGGHIGSYDRLGGSVAEEMFAPDLFSDDDEDEDEEFGLDDLEHFGLVEDDYFPPNGAYGQAIDAMLNQRYGHYRGTSYGAAWGPQDAFGTHDPAELTRAMRQLRGGMSILGEMEGGDPDYGSTEYSPLGDRVADEMFGGMMGTAPHVGTQRTAIQLGEHILS